MTASDCTTVLYDVHEEWWFYLGFSLVWWGGASLLVWRLVSTKALRFAISAALAVVVTWGGGSAWRRYTAERESAPATLRTVVSIERDGRAEVLNLDGQVFRASPGNYNGGFRDFDELRVGDRVMARSSGRRIWWIATGCEESALEQ